MNNVFKKTVLNLFVCSQLAIYGAPVLAIQGLTEAQLDALRKEAIEQYQTAKGTLAEDDKMSLVEVFMESNTLDCLDLWIEGLCMWLIVKLTLSGVSVEIKATPKISHYNPDFVVASYPRIGASPLQEADLIYSALQRELSKPLLQLMSGHAVPSSYDDEEQYGGRVADSGHTHKSITMYSEVDVIGHPGNIVSLVAKAGSGELFGDVSDLMTDSLESVKESVEAIETQTQDILTELEGGGKRVIDTVVGDNENWDDKQTGLGATEAWVTEMVQPQQLAIAQLIGKITGAFGEFTDAVDILTSPEAADILTTSAEEFMANADEEILAVIEESEVVEELTDNVTEVTDGLDVIDDAMGSLEDIDLDQLGIDANEYFENEIATLGEEALSEALGVDISELSESLTQVMENLESMQEVMDAVGVEGASFSIGELPSFCPNDTSILTPHYLSGLNILSWRYQLPELAYPHSYAFPLPDSEYFVGKFRAGSLPPLKYAEGTGMDYAGESPSWASAIEFPDWSTWGNIYPRSGWVAQPDEVKNRSVAAFRAVHVVTRENQSHLYNYADKKDPPEGMKKVWPEKLSPLDKETGAWQMLYPKKAGSCDLLPDTAADGGIFTPRDEGLTSDSGAYIYNVWRKYECCTKPKTPGLGFVTELPDIEIRIEVI